MWGNSLPLDIAELVYIAHTEEEIIDAPESTLMYVCTMESSFGMDIATILIVIYKL